MTAPVSPHLIANLLATGLASVFDTVCTQRYGAPLSLRRCPFPSSPSPLHLRLEQASQPPIEAQIDIRHVGGNMYDVHGTIADGPTQSFAYSLPDPTALLSPQIPCVVHDLTSFLLDALERERGTAFLRETLQHPPE